jgi:FMN-dependent NADH-azoreductase
VTILRLDASIQGARSASSALADSVLAEITAAHPDRPVVRRRLGAEPLPADAWATAVHAGWVPEADRTDEQRRAVALAATVAGELRAADAAVLALPLYNWGVSQHVKTWIDLALAAGNPSDRLLDGTPTVLVVTRGGAYGPGMPKEGWDHNIDYLRRILGDVWGAQITLIERELTLVGVNPALDAFTETAELMRKTDEESAVDAGRALATALAGAGTADRAAG